MNFIIFDKKKGGGHVTKCPKKAKFWANRNFWPMGWPEGPKIGRVTILAILYPHLEGISISIKNKKVMLIESYVMPKNQKSWLPPPLVLNVRFRRLCPEISMALSPGHHNICFVTEACRRRAKKFSQALPRGSMGGGDP